MKPQTTSGHWVLSITCAAALAAALRFHALRDQPLWLDEATTANFAERSALGAITAEVTHPPLFYLIEHFVVRWLGASEAALRLPSAVFGILAVPAVWALARRMFPQQRATAPFAAVLVAASPFHIYLSQEARNYSLLVLLTLVSTVFFLRFCAEGISADGRLSDLAAYALLSALLIYTHYFGAWVLLAHETVYWLHERKRPGAWLAARAGVALAYLPWALWAFDHASAGALDWVGNVVWRVPYALLRDLVGYGIAAPNITRISDPVAVVVREEGLAVALAVAPLLWLLLRGARLIAGEKRTGTLMAAVLVAPFAVLVALSPWVKLLHERAVSFQAPFVLLLVAYGLATLPRRKRLVAGALCAASITFSLAAYYGSPGEMLGYRLQYGKEDWRGAAAYVEQMKPPAVVLAPGYIRLAFERYWHLPAQQVRLMEAMEDVMEPAAQRHLAALPRIALVISHGGPAEQRLREHFDRTHQRVAEKFFPFHSGIRILLYERKRDAIPLANGVRTERAPRRTPEGRSKSVALRRKLTEIRPAIAAQVHF